MKMLLTALAGVAAPAAQAAQYGGPDRREIQHDRREIRHDRQELRHDRREARRWRQGQRLDRRYGDYYAVNDWRARRLPTPRRGYHWVRSGDDYVQAALVGGLIASVIAASR